MKPDPPLDSPPAARRRRRIGLPVALALSVLLHVLLVVGSFLVGLVFPGWMLVAAPAPEDEEPLLRFTFAENGEEELEPQLPGIPLPTPVTPGGAAPPAISTPTSEPFSEAPPPSSSDAVTPPEVGPRERRPTARTAGTRTLPPRRQPERQPEPERDLRAALRDYGEKLSQGGGPTTPSRAVRGRHAFDPRDAPALAPTGTGVENLVFESRDYDWSDYGREVYIAIWRAWHHRLWSSVSDFEKWALGTGTWALEHRARTRFVIERRGEVTTISLEAASGSPPLDASVVTALEEVILPPLPADFPRDREVVHARFLADGPIYDIVPRRQVCSPSPGGGSSCWWVSVEDPGQAEQLNQRSVMRQHLDRLKHAGLF